MLMRNPEMMLHDSNDRTQNTAASTSRENLLGQVIVMLLLMIAILLRAL
ncbi:hypothetical protein EC9_44130 [Rosistilla ulvae]|uniref:Uncharacterized protein n=1 Tax=Rosistilla ulvae TaxID=1930277 RepID=A0A517M5R0_9BACT|nr:hypothetical protein [Rosistilla ulvae]QDS90206.1 hypothetical protein EC9_44130 [Rosistilla ulvae]